MDWSAQNYLSVVGFFALSVAVTQACALKGAVSQLDDDTSGSSSGTGAVGAGGGDVSEGGMRPSDGGLGGGCAEASSEADDGEAPADIIFVVDTSSSMNLEAQWTQQNMNDMVNTIAGSGVDAHVIMISNNEICVPAPLGSGACPNDENLPNFRHVDQYVGSNNALQTIISSYPLWKDSLRKNSLKTFVVVSDDDSDMGAATFTSELLALDDGFQGFKFDAIVSFGEPWIPNTNCFLLSAAEGKVYKQLVNQTGGVVGDLCLQDFGPVFQDIATTVIHNSKIDCVYDIPNAPDGESIDYNMVNVQLQLSPDQEPITFPYLPGGKSDCGGGGGWYYDDPDNPEQIILCESTCNEVESLSEGRVTVVFGCATIIN